MALADTQTITIGGVAKTLTRTGMGLNEGAWSTSDRKFKLTVKNDDSKRFSSLIKLTYTDYVSNPLVPAENMAVSSSIWTVINNPKNGLGGAVTDPIAVGFLAWLSPLVDEIAMGQN